MTERPAMTPRPPHNDLCDDALDWQVVLHSGNAGADDHERYQRWCASSPAHARAAREAEALWGDLGQTQAARTLHAKPLSRSRRRWPRALAASIVMVAIACTGWQQAPMWFSDYHTAMNQRQTFTLADGTRVTLNGNSALSVSFSDTRREVVLQTGEALFDTASDPRPFVVDAGGEPVEGRHALFSVRRQASGAEVVLTRGEAQLGGRQLALTPDAEARTAWRRGKLIFNGKPLGQVLAELERYRHGRIFISDARLAGLEVSGVFDLDQPDALLRTLEQRYGLTVTYLPLLAVVR
ncbi:FecR domain-containing protein [Pseudomonas sp. REB1044]|uniref:FecR family protein n=1 Tax=Pseudomonas sp. REB1044 TaxID=2675224 RepID=UPI00315D1E13